MNAIPLYGPSGEVLPPSRRAMANAYQGASRTHQDLAGYLPRAFSAQGALTPDRDLLTARIHDLARNDGWTSGGIKRLVDNIIGGGWRLNARLNRRRLKLEDAQAADLSAEIEALFDEAANDPDCFFDTEQRTNFGGLMALAYAHRAGDGEAIGVISFDAARLKAGAAWGTSVQVIDPDRLASPPGLMEGPRHKAGIDLGVNGEPIAYHFRAEHPGDAYPGAMQFVRVPRFLHGRRLVVHAFEAERAGQVRGAPALAPIVKKLRMLGRYDEAELQAAVLNAVMAAFVTSPFDPKGLLESIAAGEDGFDFKAYLEGRKEFWDAAPPIRIPGVQVTPLYMGEDIKFPAASHPNAVFPDFVRASLRNIASAMGLSYEQLSSDWGEVTYSSARAALLEVWRGFTARAAFFAHQFVQPIYVRWFEEAVLSGRLKLPAGSPSFASAKAAWTRARWLMPGRGWVDPKKEAEAARIRVEAGMSTLEREIAESTGMDVDEVLEQRAREAARLIALEKKHGLPPGTLLPPRNAANGAPIGHNGGLPPEDDEDEEKE